VVDTVKGSGQVEQGQHCQIAEVQCQEYVGKDLQNSGLRRVVCSVRRLKIWKEFIVSQVLHQLLSDETFKKLGID